MDIKDYAQMMSYLTRPRDVVPEPKPMAQGGRIGFYKGKSVVKSHGQQIKDLTEAGESSVSIAKKLGLKQQTVNGAMDAMDKGIAGEEFKLSKPRKDIVKLAVNQYEPLTRTLEEVQAIIDNADPIQKKNKTVEMNPKDLTGESEYNNVRKKIGPAKVFVSRKELEKYEGKLNFKTSGKSILEDASKKNKVRQAKDLARSNPTIFRKMSGKDGYQLSHLSLNELDSLKNLGYLPANVNIKSYFPFEKKIVEISQQVYETQNNKKLSIQEKRNKIAELQKKDRELRKQFPEYAKIKARLNVRATGLDSSGLMIKEKLPDPSIAIAPTEAGTTLKEIQTGSQKDAEVVKIAKEEAARVANKLKNSDFKCKLANGLSCNDPRAYRKSIQETMAKAQKGDDAAISKINKLGKSMNKLSKAAKFTGWGILTEVGFAAPFAAIDYAKGANRDEIISNATFGLFGKSIDEQLREQNPRYGQAADLKKAYEKEVQMEQDIKDYVGGYRGIAENTRRLEDIRDATDKALDPFLMPTPHLESGRYYDPYKVEKNLEYTADTLKDFLDKKEEISKDRGILKPSTGLENYLSKGGIASLNVKK